MTQPMKTFTLVTSTAEAPPTEALSLLHASVHVEEPSAPGEYVGQTQGVVLDESGAVVAFLVRLAERLRGTGDPWTLAPTSAVHVEDSKNIRVLWTEDQLLAQPRLDKRMGLHNRLDGGPPVESSWLPARPNVVPPGRGLDKLEAVKDGLGGAAVGGVLGAAVGLAALSPVGAAGLAAFFAAGGGLAGLMFGAGRNTAAEASELKEEKAGRSRSGKEPLLDALESSLRDNAIMEELHKERFTIVRSEIQAA